MKQSEISRHLLIGVKNLVPSHWLRLLVLVVLLVFGVMEAEIYRLMQYVQGILFLALVQVGASFRATGHRGRGNEPWPKPGEYHKQKHKDIM